MSPSDQALAQYRQKQQSSRLEAAKFSQQGHLVYNGHNTFDSSFYDERRTSRLNQMQATNQLAQMRFSIHVEKAHRLAAQKELEIKNALAEQDRREAHVTQMRKTQQLAAVQTNQNIHNDRQLKLQRERDDFLQERTNV